MAIIDILGISVTVDFNGETGTEYNPIPPAEADGRP